ncbi:hypothetical protein M0812_13031 [Anaeramoeba flamelloides]|uniref:UDENN domain-containing protein n=1 Tax=Anaeramoeba flamelloides TaxID=1746091 RepID=A0AAV7ZH27_9EUKA|nr:hypothetical protein M0812_13031 [Anaeramoeba flamelloides]
MAFYCERWVECFCVITFDNTTGPNLTTLYPDNVTLTKKAQHNICFYSFPDSNSLPTSDHIYTFILETSSRTLYGYVFFRSKKDPNNSRGYTQRSIVLLTRFAFHMLFKTVIYKLGPLAWESKQSLDVIKRSYETINKTWQSSYKRGQLIDLNFLNSKFKIYIPRKYKRTKLIESILELNKKDNDIQKSNNTSNEKISTSNSNSSLNNSNSKLHLNTEKITNQNINKNSKTNTQMGTNKSTSTSTNSSKNKNLNSNNQNLSNQNNLEYSSIECAFNSEELDEEDLEDMERVELVKMSISGAFSCSEKYHSLDADLYGIFKRILSDLPLLWQLVLTGEPLLITSNLPELCSDASLALSGLLYPIEFHGPLFPYLTVNNSGIKRLTIVNESGGWILGTTNPQFAESSFKHIQNKLFIGRDIQNERGKKIKFPDKIKSQTTPIIKFSNIFLKRLKKNSKNVDKEQQILEKNLQIREFFWKLNRKFISPIEEYFSMLIPSPDEITPFYKPPIIKGFNENTFLEYFLNNQIGKSFEKKQKWVPIYKKFFHTDTFLYWYQTNKQKSKNDLFSIYRNMVLHFDVEETMKEMNDLRKVDFFQRILEKYKIMSPKDDPELSGKIEEYLIQILSLVPENYKENLKAIIESVKEQHIEDEEKEMGEEKEKELMENTTQKK